MFNGLGIKLRTLLGMAMLMLFLLAYIVAAVWLAAQLVDGANIVVQTLFYVVAGLIWTWPAIKIITWIKKPR